MYVYVMFVISETLARHKLAEEDDKKKKKLSKSNLQDRDRVGTGHDGTVAPDAV